MNNFRNSFTALLIGVIVLVAFHPNDTNADIRTVSDSAEVIELLKERDQEIKEELGPKGTDYTDAQREKLKNIINGIIDYRAMASYALANTWDTLSTDKKQEFSEVFSEVVRNQSLNKLDIYRAEVSYKKVDVTGDSAYVETMAILDNVRTPVYYTMRKQNETWVIVDFSIDEVSTAKSYRRSFQNIIKRKGYQALYNSLEKKTNA